MCVPELRAQASELGELRGEVRSWMELRRGEVAPDEAEAVEAVQECLHRSTGSEAVLASEVPILDERRLGLFEPVTGSRSRTAGRVLKAGVFTRPASLRRPSRRPRRLGRQPRA